MKLFFLYFPVLCFTWFLSSFASFATSAAGKEFFPIFPSSFSVVLLSFPSLYISTTFGCTAVWLLTWPSDGWVRAPGERKKHGMGKLPGNGKCRFRKDHPPPHLWRQHMLQWSKSINSSCVLCIAVFEKIIEVSDILLFCTVCFECKGLDLASQWWSWNIHIYYYIIIFNIGINPPQNSLLEFSFLFYIDLQWINNYCVLSSCDCCQSFASNQFFIEGLTIVRQDKAQDIVFCPQTMGFTFGGIIR